jgi:hypothetical protein
MLTKRVGIGSQQAAHLLAEELGCVSDNSAYYNKSLKN